MSVVRTVPYQYYISGSNTLYDYWSHVFGSNMWVGEHWTIRSLPFYGQNNAAYVDMSLNVQLVDSRNNDRLTLTDPHGQGATYVLNIKGVEHVDAPAADEVHLEIVGKVGFTTDGSLDSLRMNVGHHTMVYTGATRDQTLFMGSGWDTVQLVDHPDVANPQYWSVIRRVDGEVDAYSLYSGNRVRMEDGVTTWGNTNGRVNYGEVDEIQLASRIRVNGDVHLLGTGLSATEDRGSFDNIDLSTTGSYDFTDRLNSASFKSINYATTNVHKGTAVVESFAGDRVSGTQSSIKDHITLNGVHYLIVEQQAAALDGHLRLYVRDNTSGLYNRFNEVFLGASGSDVNANDYATTSRNAYANDATGSGTTKVLGTVMYGFEGNDVLTASSDVDYLFGGTSTYSTIVTINNLGNQLTGGDGSDYFGVGNISAGADGDAIMSTDFTARLFGSAPLSSSNTGELARLDVAGSGSTSVTNYASDTADLATRVATDRITDWTAGSDYLRVLANGTAIIEGLGTANGAGGAYVADAIGSDAELIDLSGARVNNEGKTVARGLGGVDTLVGSTGDDWLYGNAATNYYSLSSGGNDRVYVDQFDGSRSKHYVTGFTRSDGVVADRDLVMLNKRIIDAFYSGGAGRAALKLDIDATYTSGQAKSSGVNYLYNNFYSGSYASNNATHSNADGGGFWEGGGGADGTSSYIGLGMAIAGRGMFAIPFVGPIIGAAMIGASIPIEGLGFDPSPTREHLNATYNGTVNAYLNVLTDSYGGNGVSLNTTTGVNDTGVRFLDFFQGANTGDGYLPVVEFTAHSGQSIYGYFALHSDDETFVFLVASSDNMVENAEAIFVAEINGRLTAADFGIYDGERDAYNYSTIPAVVIRTPTVTKVADSATPTADEAQVDGVLSDVQNPIVISGTVSGALEAGSYFRVYDGPNKIYDGDSAVAGQQVTHSLNATNFTFTDSRALGTTVQNTTNTGLNDTFVLSDAYVRYTVELIDGETGLPTRASVNDIRVSGGNATIDGGNGSDILLVTETSPFLNGVSDVRLVGMERIVLAGSVTIVNGNQVPTPISINLSNQSEGFDIVSGTAGDTIVASSGNDVIYGVGGADSILAGNGADTVVYSTGYETITTLVNNVETNTTTNNIVSTAAASLAADLTVDGGDGVDSLQFDTDRYDGNTLMYSAPVVLADADFQKIIRFENLVLNGTGTQTVALGANANAAFATGITVTTVATATSLNFDASNAGWTRTAHVTGTNNADTITGGSGNDTLIGLAGADTITAGTGNDSLSGGDDGDTFVLASNLTSSDTISGGDGGTNSDTLTFSDANGAADDLNNVTGIETITLGNATTVVTTVNTLVASGATLTVDGTALTAATLTWNGAAETDGKFSITGGAAADTIIGGSGNDTIIGGAGSDSITAGTGNDSLSGDDDEDTFVLGSNLTSADTIVGGDGGTNADVLTFTDSNGAANDLNNVTGIETVRLGNATTVVTTVNTLVASGATLTVDGTALTSATLTWDGAAETDGKFNIAGGNADDVVAGGSGADTIVGGTGADTIVGGAGNDNLSGDAGADVFLIASGAHHGASETITGGTESDTIRFTSTTANDTLTLSANVTDQDNLLNVAVSTGAGVTSGTTDLNVTAAALTGSLAVNLTGNDGANQLTGTANADTISGGAGNDTITGGSGDDLIVGGIGADSLAGGLDRDTFKIEVLGESTSTSMDVITDFSFGVSGDALDLSAIDGIGKVGYTNDTFDSLSAFINYVKNTFTYIVSGEKQVVVGTVVDANAPSDNGVYALSHTIDAVYWGPSDTNSSIIKLSGVPNVSGISASNFVGEHSVEEILSLTVISNITIPSTLAAPLSGPVLVNSEDLTGDPEYISNVVYINPSITRVDTKVVATFIHTTVSSAPGRDQFASEQGIVVVPSVFTLQTTSRTATSFSMQNFDMQVLNSSEVANVINFATVASGWQGAQSFFYFDGTADRAAARNDDYGALWFWNDRDNNGTADTSELELVAQYNNAGYDLKNKIFFTPAATTAVYVPTSSISDTGIAVNLLTSGQILSFRDGSNIFQSVTSTGAATTTLTLNSSSYNKVGYFALEGSTPSALEAGAYVVTGTDAGETIDATSRLGAPNFNGAVTKVYLYGFGGSDSIVGQSGVDVVFGGTGDDTILGGAGIDQLYGGDDNDTFALDSAVADQTGGAGEVLSGGNGTDRIVVAGGSLAVNFSDDTISSIETLELTTNVAGAADGNDQYLTMTDSQIDGFSTINANDGTTLGSSDSIVVLDAMTSDMLDGTVVNGTIEFILTEQYDGSPTAHQLVLRNATTVSSSELIKINGVNLIEDDTLSVNGSNETSSRISVIGGIANDTIIGGSGDDTLQGGDGTDSLDGGTGNDTFVFDTAAGDQTLGAVAGPVETIFGGLGTDTLVVSGGSLATDFSDDQITSVEILELTKDADGVADTHDQSVTLTATQIAGFSTIISNDGSTAGSSDIITISNAVTSNMLDGTIVNGTLEIKLTDQQTTTVVAQALTVLDTSMLASTDLLKINGSALTSDTLNFNGSQEANARFSITGGGGADTLVGGSSADTIIGGAGADQIVGGLGDDVIVVNGTADIAAGETHNGGGGNDTLSVTADTDFSNVASIAEIETIVAAGGVDLIFNAATVTGQTISINGTDDNLGETLTVNGTSSAETINLAGLTIDSNDFLGVSINAGNGSDTITGTNGSDTIDGGAGADVIVGGDGNDVIVVNGTADIAAGESYNGDDGNDTLSVTADTNFAGISSLVSIETIVAATGVDLTFNAATVTGQTIAINGTGNNAGESLTINGTSSGEAINLGSITVDLDDIAGATVNAGDGNDSVTGTNGNDYINGGIGDDVLVGGAGRDTLVGGDGADVFDFDASSITATTNNLANMDVVSDFDSALDRFDLGTSASNITIVAISAGDGGDGDDYVLSWLSGGQTQYVRLSDTGTSQLATSTQTYTSGTGILTLAVTSGPGFDQFIVTETGITVSGDGPFRAYLHADGLAPERGTPASYYTKSGNYGASNSHSYDFTVIKTGAPSSNESIGTAFSHPILGARMTIQSTSNPNTNTTHPTYLYIGDNASGAVLDTLTAAPGQNSIMYGFDGADTITGNDGNDTIFGGAGDDQITGGAGGDSINGGTGTNSVTDAGAGADTVTHNSVSSTVAVAVTGTGTVTLTASQVGATANSAMGVNTTVNASTSTAGVALNGNTGADTLTGGSAADTITGGAGADRMTGGTGADTFVYNTGVDGTDTITDFVSGVDKYDTNFVTSNTTSAELILSSSNVLGSSGDVSLDFVETDYELLRYAFNFSTNRVDGDSRETVEDPFSVIDLMEALEAQLVLDDGGTMNVATNGQFSAVTANASFFIQITNTANNNSYLLEAINDSDSILLSTEVGLVAVFENATLTAVDIL